MVGLITQAPFIEKRLAQPNYDVPGTEFVDARAKTEKTFGSNVQFPILLTGPPKVLDRRGPVYAERLERLTKASVLSPWDGGQAARPLRPRKDAAMLVAIVD